jgi:hypothetical protein
MKLRAIRYWLPTSLLLLFMVGSGIMYIFQGEEIAKVFVSLGYAPFTMWFNASAKILGGIAIAFPFPRFLKEFAYAGYLYIMLLATQAMWMTMPGIPWLMFAFLALWTWAYWEFRRRNPA